MANESVATQTVETVTFPCEEWVATRTKKGNLVAINPVPGTWTLIGGEDRRRFAERGKDIKAMFACPRCNQVGIIPESFNPPKELGDTKPLPELFCRKCKFGCKVILQNWDTRKLYCACYETCVGGKFHQHKEYLHAEDELEAKKFFWAQHGSEVSTFIAIAPVIGFFTKNPKDDRVLVV
jgi:transcription elongation factor Elf1